MAITNRSSRLNCSGRLAGPASLCWWILLNDPVLDKETRDDRMRDIDSLRSQLMKREPDPSVLASLLDDLAAVPSSVSKVAELTRILNT